MRRNATIGLDPLIVDILVLIVVVVFVVAIVVGSTLCGLYCCSARDPSKSINQGFKLQGCHGFTHQGAKHQGISAGMTSANMSSAGVIFSSPHSVASVQ